MWYSVVLCALNVLSVQGFIKLVGRLAVVEIDSEFSYSISFINPTAKSGHQSQSYTPWLTDGGIYLQCEGSAFDSFNGSLYTNGTAVLLNGSDARYGDYVSASQQYLATNPACAVVASIRYYPASDAFEFM